MVYKNNVMIGDIIRKGMFSLEVKEISKSSVTGTILKLGHGDFIFTWSETNPYGLTDKLMECLGFTKVVNTNNSHLWEKISNGMKLVYDTEDHGLSIISVSRGERRGFCFIYIYFLHELMHKCKDFGVETCQFYKQILSYNPPTSEDFK